MGVRETNKEVNMNKIKYATRYYSNSACLYLVQVIFEDDSCSFMSERDFFKKYPEFSINDMNWSK